MCIVELNKIFYAGDDFADCVNLETNTKGYHVTITTTSKKYETINFVINVTNGDTACTIVENIVKSNGLKVICRTFQKR
jgi:hypothetical protein